MRDASSYDPHTNSFVDEDIIEAYSKHSRHPVPANQAIDPRLEKYLRTRLSRETNEKDVVQDQGLQKESKKVLIEEEQEIISYNVTDGDASVEP